MSEKISNEKKEEIQKPSADELRKELIRIQKKSEFRKTLKQAIFAVLVAGAIAVLISSFFVTVLRISGNSMYPSLETGEIVLARNTEDFQVGEMIAFYYNNKVLVKRVIGSPGDWINIDEAGNVSINGNPIEEDYLVTKKSLEPTDIKFPYQVPENRYFVLGDNRSESIDSRSNSVGCVTKEQLIGKVFFRVYPFGRMGILKTGK
ncbi:signal peptidase I [Butyrivibrio sp. NC3005]|uniref:signal peptidase I n=1 Tax=Butyrivibrio sp. NC3005 TaxID=1280685 RepID=UPI0004240F16|nr:signal peptidase I [Butyrivibrio sp. NC3005]